MILVGYSGSIAKALLDTNKCDEFYKENHQVICDVLFNETRFGIRFHEVVFETLKRFHASIAYILRKQYQYSDEIYFNLINACDKETPECQSLYAFGLLNRLEVIRQGHDLWHKMHDYFNSIYVNLIVPVLKKFGYFSPMMVAYLFIGLLCHLGNEYSSSYYNLLYKHILTNKNNEYGHETIARAIQGFVPSTLKLLTIDEQNTWKKPMKYSSSKK